MATAIQSQSEAVQWYKVITDFPNYWNNLQKNFQALLAQSQYITEKHPELRPEYDRLVRTGSENYQKMYEINAAISGIKSRWSDFTSWLGDKFTLNGLGLVPIYIAISAASAAAVLYSVGKWLTETATFAQRVEESKRLEAQGMTPAQVNAAIATRYGTPDSGTLFGIPIKWVIGGALVLVFAPMVLNLLKPKRG